MNILQECKRFLPYGGLGTEQYVDIGRIRVPRTMVRTLLTSILLILSILYAIKCFIAYPLGLQAMLFPVHCLLINNTKLIIYRVFLWKTDQIAQLIDYLQAVVKERKFL